MSPLIPRGFAELFYGPRVISFYDHNLPLNGGLIALPIFRENSVDDRTDSVALSELTAARQLLRENGRNGAVRLRND
jgi:hypothetical protein